MHLSTGGVRGPFALIYHGEVKIEEEVMDTNKPAISVRLLGNVMISLALLQKVMYAICSHQNIDFRMVLEKQEFRAR